MINQNLIIYQFIPLYQILKEIEKDINFNVVFSDNEQSLKIEIKKFKNYLIITKDKNLEIKNKIIIDNLPLRIIKIVEKLNIEFIKNKFVDQSQININDYTINLNSKEISFENKNLKLTEKEIKTIIYLSKANNPITINELQTEVWGYQMDLETHTVETHIYRLRKKFLNFFNDKNFISSEKNGYKIK